MSFQKIPNGSINNLQNHEVKKTINNQFSQDFDHHQSGIESNPFHSFKYRLTIIMITLFITIIGQFITTPKNKINCIYDPGHQFTDNINNNINTNNTFAKILQSFSSLILDTSFTTICVYQLLYVRTLRFFFALLTFYGIRLLHLQLLILRIPDGYFWDYPGIPSIVVQYGANSDFFYSGHCGFLFLCSLEWRRLNRPKLSYLLLISSIFQAFIVITFRIHYTIDVPGGYVYAHWIYRLTCDYEIQIDRANKQFIDKIKQIFAYKNNDFQIVNSKPIENNEIELKIHKINSI